MLKRAHRDGPDGTRLSLARGGAGLRLPRGRPRRSRGHTYQKGPNPVSVPVWALRCRLSTRPIPCPRRNGAPARNLLRSAYPLGRERTDVALSPNQAPARVTVGRVALERRGGKGRCRLRPRSRDKTSTVSEDLLYMQPSALCPNGLSRRGAGGEGGGGLLCVSRRRSAGLRRPRPRHRCVGAPGSGGRHGRGPSALAPFPLVILPFFSFPGLRLVLLSPLWEGGGRADRHDSSSVLTPSLRAALLARGRTRGSPIEALGPARSLSPSLARPHLLCPSTCLRMSLSLSPFHTHSLLPTP